MVEQQSDKLGAVKEYTMSVTIAETFELLFDKNNKIAYKALQELQKVSTETDCVYPYMDKLSDMLESDNSYVRTRGLTLLAYNAKWDKDYKIDEIIDKYLRHITDVKPITARQCIKLFLNVFSYVRNPEKTDNGEYVSAVNCLKETALEQMILTKKQYQKSGRYIAWHGYQSFKPNEVTPEQCHEIGLKLAKEMWGDKYQIIVTTHLDKEHLHNHFCFNSVSFVDGRKYDYSKSEQKRLRNVSDRLCREYGLSVIKHPKKALPRPLYLDEKTESRHAITSIWRTWQRQSAAAEICRT